MAPMPQHGRSTDGEPLDRALTRLDGALVALRRAVAVRAEAARMEDSHRDDLARLERDRAALADQLDASEARAERLKAANVEVAERLVKVMEMVRRMEGGA